MIFLQLLFRAEESFRVNEKWWAGGQTGEAKLLTNFTKVGETYRKMIVHDARLNASGDYHKSDKWKVIGTDPRKTARTNYKMP